MKKISIYIICIAWLNVSCKKENTSPTLQVNDSTANVSDTLGKGIFTSYEHGLKGNAILYNQISGDLKLRLENFNMTPGPDVYLFLSTSNVYSSGTVIEVAKLTSGFAGSNINFKVTNPAYTKDHRFVLVYCKEFSSLFGFTLLN